jgi:hypothetical protein
MASNRLGLLNHSAMVVVTKKAYRTYFGGDIWREFAVLMGF